MAHARATLGRADWSEAEIARAKRRAYARFNRARGWESPRAAVGTSKAQRQRRRARRGNAQSGAHRGLFSQHPPSGAGGSPLFSLAFCKAIASPESPLSLRFHFAAQPTRPTPPRPMGERTIKVSSGTLIATSPSGAGMDVRFPSRVLTGDCEPRKSAFISLSFRRRRSTDTSPPLNHRPRSRFLSLLSLASQPTTRPSDDCLRAFSPAPSTPSLCQWRVARGCASAGSLNQSSNRL